MDIILFIDNVDFVFREIRKQSIYLFSILAMNYYEKINY